MVFTSQRLRFEYPRESLSDELAGWLCDLDNQRLMSPTLPYPRDPATILARIRSSHPAPFTGAGNAYELAICLPESPAPVGIAGLYSVDFTHSTAEIGVSLLRPDLQGKGLGREAHERWLEYAFDDMGFQRLTGSVKSINPRAIAVAHQIGMTTEGVLRSHRVAAGTRIDIVLLGILRDEWVERRSVRETGEAAGRS
jgi:RimJ/RimL family protein N-acetyltransferase